MAKVTIIPSTKANSFSNVFNPVVKRKVAAYARVSTDSDEQFTSFEAQCNYYENYINSKPDWELVKVYADEGISGTNTKNRTQFKQMIEDALGGKIDLIITKSISRFARNTLDTINYTRKLKAKGVEVYFEKENLWTFDDKAEFLLAIMSSITQEESRSISQNVTMGKRWQMKEGKVSFAYKTFLGYKKENGKIAIDEEQAVIVRLIYREFLVCGKTASAIANMLNLMHVLTPGGKIKWTKNTVTSILTNEKYKGDAILQKTFIKDFLEHKAVKNQGELPQYFVENSHPAIIGKDMWEMVQAEIKRRKEIGPSYSSVNAFSSKLVCGDCGGFYGKKIWHSTKPWRKEIYRCNKKYSDANDKCQTPFITEDEVKSKFIKAYNQVMVKKEQVINDANEVIKSLTDTSLIDNVISETESELEVISELVRKLVRENASHSQNQDDYTKKYKELEARYEKTKNKLDELNDEKQIRKGKLLELNSYLATFKEAGEILTDWDDNLWMTVLDKAIVNRDGTITFKFIVGIDITI